MQKYIFIDIDGTLLDSTGHVPEMAKIAIERAQNNGHRVFVNTGRAKSGMPPGISDIKFDGYVYSAGTVVEVGEEQIFFEALESEDVQFIMGKAGAYGISFSLEGYARSFIDETAKEKFEKEDLFAKSSIMTRPLPVAKYDPKKDHIHKFALFSYEKATFQLLKEYIPKHLKMILHGSHIRGLYLAEVIKDDLNKATGIEKVLSYYGASVHQTICFGDSMNDYEMVEFCDLGICMENGDATLKNVADAVALSADEDGIYHAFVNNGLIEPI